MEQIFDRDPNGAMIAFEEMMRKKIVMPAHLMFDGENENLFQDYASVRYSFVRPRAGLNL